MAQYRILERGDPAPWFRQRATNTPEFVFDTAAGRYILLCFFASASDDQGKAMVSLATEERSLFDDDRLAFFGVSVDPSDESEERVKQAVPGVRYFWDFNGSISRTYGALPVDAKDGANARRFWLVLDPMMRVIKAVDARADGSDRAEVAAFLRELPPVDAFAGVEVQAPVIRLSNVFEPEFCDQLIELYEKHGGVESGFMREVDGKTVAATDPNHKKRADHLIQNAEMIVTLQKKMLRRIVPEIKKVHQFNITRMERYIVSCYDTKDGGHFRAHRDNTTRGTAHRRFAVSINLNDDFDGGEIGFPEYGPRTYKPPRGGAVVFSCSLLHAVSKVTRGRRYAFLPFLYDDAAAALREENNKYLAEGVGAYRNTG